MTRAKCDGRPSIVASLQHPKLASRLKQVLTGLEVQPPDYWLYDHTKPGLAL